MNKHTIPDYSLEPPTTCDISSGCCFYIKRDLNMTGIKALQSDEERKFYTELAQFLVAQRLKLGISQKDIAKLTGITYQQVQKYETAQCRIPTYILYKLATAYGISFANIIGTNINCDYRVLDTARVETLINNAQNALHELSEFLTSRN